MSESGRVQPTDGRPEWGEVALLPRGKYRVEEQDDGWHVYSREYEQGMSAPARVHTEVKS